MNVHDLRRDGQVQEELRASPALGQTLVVDDGTMWHHAANEPAIGRSTFYFILQYIFCWP